MNIKKTVSVIVLMTMIASTISGCSFGMPIPEAVPTTEVEDTLTTLGLEPDLSYERPVVEAHIEIDQLGYLPSQNKLAIFRGDGLTDEFRVICVDTGEVAYTGKIKSKTISGSDEIYFFGDFSDLTKEGVYSVQTDVIGYSYPFTISENLYDGLLEEAMKQFYFNRCGFSLTRDYAGDNTRNACHTGLSSLRQDGTITLDVTGGWHVDTAGDRDVIRGCDAIETMLLAYEYNPEFFGDDIDIPESGDGIPDVLNEIKYETEWLLKMQDQASGAVHSSISVVDNGSHKEDPCHIEDIDISSTLSFASSMGYFSYLYQAFDTAYATTCIKAADRAMKYVTKFADKANPDEYFRAAAMLYRATGYNNYKYIVENYMRDMKSLDMSNNVVFVGCVTYLATKQKTRTDYCDLMTKGLKEYAVNLSTTRGDYLYLMGEEADTVKHEDLLPEIARLTVVNYMISSNEYEKLMEKYLHYFMGCNPTNMCYVGQYGSTNITEIQAASDILKQPEMDSYFILLLSGVKQH